jgi:hypothetical protein
VPPELAHGVNVGDLLGVVIEGEVLGHLPDEHLAILRRGGDNTIVERVPPAVVSIPGVQRQRLQRIKGVGASPPIPVGVEHGGSVAPEQGHLVRQLASLIQGDDGKGAAAGRVPIDRQILRVDLFASCANAMVSDVVLSCVS